MRFRLPASLVVIGSLVCAAVSAQTGPASPVVVYEGARLIVGPAATAPIDDGAFVVQNGMITAIGRKARSRRPPARRASI